MNRVKLWLVVLLLTACSEAVAPTRLPTLTLVPPTSTPTSTPVTPTVTPVGLPGPGDLVIATPAARSVSIPEQAEPLLQRALAALAAESGIPEDEIQLLRLESAVWTSLDLGCGQEQLPGAVDLGIEGFRMVLLAGGQEYEYHTDNRNSVRQCENADAIAGETHLLLETDPVAAEMVALASRRLAGQLDLVTRRIQVVDVASYTWPDSSLGCPQPGASYSPINIEGYRIVLAAGDDEYIFHTDSTQIMACEAENENLP